MKQLRYILLVILGLTGLVSQAQNTVSIPNVEAGAGKSITIPIEMTNTDEIVAAQFNVHMPFSKTYNQEVTLNSRRNTNGHTVAIKALGDNVYTIVIVNMSNKPLAGNAGTLLNFPITVSSTAEPGETYPMSITDVVLTNRKGDNIQTGATEGVLTIQQAASPDLEVSNVTVKDSRLTPGSTLDLSWTVKNVGSANTAGGWSEKVYLVNEDTEESTYLGDMYMNNILMKGASIVRHNVFTIPETIGTEGELRVRVELVPNSDCGEYQVDRANNTAISTEVCTLSRRLFLSTPATSISEGGAAVRFTLKRSGNRSMAETFTLSTDQPSLLSVPTEITIPAGQSSVSFTVSCPDNVSVNTATQAEISISATSRYNAVACTLEVIDNDLMPMTLKLDKAEYNEGDVMHLTVTLPRRVEGEEVMLTFAIEKEKRFSLPQSYVMPEGKLTATIDIPVKQDKTPANAETIQLTVAADRYAPTSTLFILNDDDVPAINLTLQKDVVSEKAGYNAIFATLTRSEVTDTKITVKLSDDGNKDIYYPTTLTLPAGTLEQTFYISTYNNNQVDGDRVVNLKAEVYIADCDCQATGQHHASVSKAITITDDDGPALFIESSMSTILEGNEAGTRLTITRNNETTQALTVSLTCQADGLSFPATVTIPAGQSSTTATLYAPKNSTQEGNRSIIVYASSNGYSKGSVVIMVSDQTLPDASIENPIWQNQTVAAGSQFGLTCDIRNLGAAPLIANKTYVHFYLNGKVVGEIHLLEDVPVGGSASVNFTHTAPVTPGTYPVSITVNKDRRFTELQYSNNTFSADINVTSTYVYTTQADKEVYHQGETVTITGHVSHLDGTPAKGVSVEPFVVNSGLRTALKATTDEKGDFSVSHTLVQGMCGTYMYGTCDPDEGIKTSDKTFTVMGFSRSTTEYLKHKLYVGELYANKFEIENLSDRKLTNIRATVSDPSGNYEVIATPVSLLEGKGKATVNYSILPKDVSKAKAWDVVEVTLTSDEGESSVVTLYCYSSTHFGTLTTSVTSINTTVTKETSRTYPIILTNTGLAETGKISIVMPEAMANFISLTTPKEMPSMQPGDSVHIMLRFTAGSLPVNLIQKGSFAINAENANGITINFNTKVVSEAKGNLRVYAFDEYNQNGATDGSAPYVKGATVQLSDYNTGAICGSGIVGEDGYVDFEDMDEGYYRLYVTAEKHDEFRQNVLISPGETNTIKAFISYQAISVKWDVVETEIEDEYEITTTLAYETQVPVPVVLMTCPDTLAINELASGESLLFNVVLRNKGLINAENTHISLPEVKGFTFKPLVAYEGLTLAPEESYVIPILVTNDKNGSGSGNDPNNSNPGGNATGGDGDNGDNTPGGGGGGSSSSGGSSGGSGIGGGGGSSSSGGSSGGSGEGNTPGGNTPGGDDGDDGDNGGGNGGGGDSPCQVKINAAYEWPCGKYSKFGFIGRFIYTPRKSNTCVGSTVGSTYSSGSGSGSSGIGISDWFDVPTAGGSGGVLDIDALVAIICTMLECLPIDIPFGDCVRTAFKEYDHYHDPSDKESETDMWDYIGCAISFAPEGSQIAEAVGNVSSARGCVQMAAEQAKKYNNAHHNRAQKRANNENGLTDEDVMPELLVSYWMKNGLYAEYFKAWKNVYAEMLGSAEAIDNFDGAMAYSLQRIDKYLWDLYDRDELFDIDTTKMVQLAVWPNPYIIVNPTQMDKYWNLVYMMPSHFYGYKGFNVRKYVDRFRNDVLRKVGREPMGNNYTDEKKIARYLEQADSLTHELVDWGYVDWEEMITSANNDRLEFFENNSKNTCAHVQLKIDQKLVLTRQAFRGTLTVDNDTDHPLTEIDLNVIVKNLLGIQTTSHEMQISRESLTGFQGSLDGKWSLPAKATGVATILFIPTKYAAPDTLTTYSFGGILTFMDGEEERTVDLYPVKLQVKPSPDLDLTYFMQRDVYGDNPLTIDKVEPIIPAEFSLLIHNKGNGDANKVRMVTKQPRITDDEKGTLINFSILSSSLNGGEKVLPIDGTLATEFGDIPAGNSAYATWELTCDLLGHFTNYDVSYSHITDYNNPDLSLLDQVTIHELIHSVNANLGDSIYRAWVVNDYPDGHEEPDHIYFANGTDQNLQTLSDVTEVVNLGNSQYRISVTVPTKEWFYTKVNNPGLGHSKILYLRNADTGEEMDPRNFWTTDYTMVDGWDPILEYKLHIVDFAPEPGTYNYIVEFEPQPEKWLNVKSIETVPDEQDIAEETIDELTVTFNKDIDHTTFTRDDIVVRYEGKTQTVDIPITRVTQSVYKLNTSALNQNGYYMLEVKADSILDQEGFYGTDGKLVRWMLFKDGLAHMNAGAYPYAKYGNIVTSFGSMDADLPYGQSVTLTAQPQKGYNFMYWAEVQGQVLSQDNEGVTEDMLSIISEDPTLTVSMDKTYRLRAVFTPKKYSITVKYNNSEGQCNIVSGVYDYGTELSFSAEPAEGYRADGYTIDDVKVAQGGSYLHTVEGDATIVVDFKSTAPTNVLLSEIKDYTPEAIEVANVNLYRSFRKGSWNTIVLPCAVTNPAEVFGTGTQVARMTGLAGNTVQFALVDEMEANTPYLIQPGRINTSMYEDNQTPTLLYTIGVTEVKEPNADEPTVTTDGISFIGTYTSRSVETEAGNYYLSGNKFYYVDAAANISTRPFYGYFHSSNEAGVKLDLGMEGATGISIIPAYINQHTGVYRLDGTMVRPAGASLDRLQPGLYIINGRKVQVR